MHTSLSSRLLQPIKIHMINPEGFVDAIESAFFIEPRNPVSFIRQRVFYHAKFTVDDVRHGLKLTSHTWQNPLVRVASLLRLNGYPENVVIALLAQLSADDSMSLVS